MYLAVCLYLLLLCKRSYFKFRCMSLAQTHRCSKISLQTHCVTLCQAVYPSLSLNNKSSSSWVRCTILSQTHIFSKISLQTCCAAKCQAGFLSSSLASKNHLCNLVVLLQPLHTVSLECLCNQAVCQGNLYANILAK